MSIENDIDNLSKWLNEGIVSDIDRKALARVLGHLRYAPKQDTDPCAGCPKGAVCKTPTCGRLRLPVDHVLRTGYSK
jgi:hypothetical protein